jgi:hypothetical protein
VFGLTGSVLSHSSKKKRGVNKYGLTILKNQRNCKAGPFSVLQSWALAPFVRESLFLIQWNIVISAMTKRPPVESSSES